MKQGLLLIDKPEDWTSFDVVNYVRRILANKEEMKPKQIKVGHSGTLDPFATGLLILLIGKEYTKRANEYTKQAKTYTFELILGQSSTTGDKTGSITAVSSYKPPLEEVETAVNKFVGELMQTPPAFSAIKINGVRSYKLARAGQEAKLEARPVVVYATELLSYEYPKLLLKAHVSSGTYIRSLAVDIGEELKVGAYVASLRRETIGEYSVNSASKLKSLDKINIEQFIESP